MHCGPGSEEAFDEMGRLFDSSKQYCKAAHYYKMQIMEKFGSFSPRFVCLAVAYDWDSILTGKSRIDPLLQLTAEQH